MRGREGLDLQQKRLQFSSLGRQHLRVEGGQQVIVIVDAQVGGVHGIMTPQRPEDPAAELLGGVHGAPIILRLDTFLGAMKESCLLTADPSTLKESSP